MGIVAGLAAMVFFAASEGAIAGRAGTPLGSPERLGAIALGRLVAVLWTAALAWLALSAWAGAPLPWWATAGFVVATAFLLHVVGEQIPRAVTHARPQPWARLAAPLLTAWQVVAFPATRTAAGVARLVARAAGPPQGTGDPITSREIRSMVEETSARAEIELEERQMITSIFAFGETTAREVMTPRTDIFALDASVPVREAIDRVREAEHSRVLVYRDDLDVVAGFLQARDLLAVAFGLVPLPESLAPLLQEPFFVPEGKRIDDLLRDFQAGVALAVVVDEYGGTAGIVTLEDVLEEMVGEIQDEYDQEPPLVVPMGDGSLGVDGRLDADDFHDLTGAGIESEGSAETIGGLVARELGRVPQGGESVRIGDWVFEVEAVVGKRVTRVRARRDEARGGSA
jgi:CBS domain containing-hemolysin-like protein